MSKQQVGKVKLTNPSAKRVTPEEAYECFYRAADDATIWVLKKYQSPEKESANQYATWYVAVKSISTYGSYEYGDTYAHNLIASANKIDNPLCSYACCCMDDNTSVEVVTPLQKYRHVPMRVQHEMLVNYTRIAVPKNKLAEFKQFAEQYALRIICMDSEYETALCLADLDIQRFKQIEATGEQTS